MKQKLIEMPIMAMVVMQSILCSCGNSGKPQVDEQAVKDSIENAVKDSIRKAVAVVPPNPFAGKTYEGNGNGGGLYTEMTISFLEDGKCRGTSDWYQAYSEKKTINGTYHTEGDKLVATFMVDDVEVKLVFDVSDNGRVLSFDHSDPEMGGTMGTDIMALKLK